jgi:ribulose-5-phosphate 4-epimerase/fuculose-1-phosphate aldolase
MTVEDLAMNGVPGARRLIADGCRVLAHEGLVSGTLGHISTRHGPGMLIRARGPLDRGLEFATAEDVVLSSLDRWTAFRPGGDRTQ